MINIKSPYQKNRHSCYGPNYHLVVATKYRNKVINKDILDELKNICKNIFEEKWNCNIVKINGESDHIHILFEAPPQVQRSRKRKNSRYLCCKYFRHACFIKVFKRKRYDVIHIFFKGIIYKYILCICM